MASYYKHNMELLNREVRDELFGSRDIYTKVRDSAPSKYGAEVTVKNSLISDGCEIEGTVENSILFRGVTVAKGATVRNSIIMQDGVVESGANVNYIIADKGATITQGRALVGYQSYPIVLSKGTIV